MFFSKNNIYKKFDKTAGFKKIHNTIYLQHTLLYYVSDVADFAGDSPMRSISYRQFKKQLLLQPQSVYRYRVAFAVYQTMNNEQETVKKPSNNIPLDLLRCALCRQLLSSSPVYSHKNGDSICYVCYVDEAICKNEYFRNVLYENVMQDVGFPCGYVSYGCEEHVRFNDTEHEKRCDFKFFDCPITQTDCGFKGTVNDIWQHLRKLHRYKWLIRSGFSFSIIKGAEDVNQTKLLYTHGCVYVINFAVYKNGAKNDQICAASVTKVTNRECNEKCTIIIEHEPEMVFRKKMEIATLVDSATGWRQNVTNLFEMIESEKIDCQILIDD